MYLLGSSIGQYLLGSDSYDGPSGISPAIHLTAAASVYPPGQSGSSENVNKIVLNATLHNIAESPVTFQVRDTASSPWQLVTTDTSSPYEAAYNTTFIPDGTVKRFRASAVHNGSTIYSDEITAVVDNAPVVTMVAPSGIQTGPFNIQVSFNEPVAGITAGSFTLTNGAVVTSISGSGSQYVLAVSPPNGSTGSITITLPIGSGEDSGGNAITGLNAILGGVREVTVQFDTSHIEANPQIISIGGDNIVSPGETVTVAAQDITFANIDQVVLAGNAGEYAIPFNGSAQVTIPAYVPAGTYTLKLREFA
jgi:hypothetical protein